MKVLRHEEFREGCEATCNGPYAGKWSKTMVGYGEEDTYFVIELTYNYGVSSYQHSNDLIWIKISSKEVLENVIKENYPHKIIDTSPKSLLLSSPDGYAFTISSENSATYDPVTEVCLATKDIQRTQDYYSRLLPGTLISRIDGRATVQFCDYPWRLSFELVTEPIVKTSASGRIAFSSSDEVSVMEEKMRQNGQSIKMPLVRLDTPGKATVEVVILLDPDEHEICVVCDAGFRELSKYDPAASEALLAAMAKDKSDDWFTKRGGKKTL